MVLLSCKIFCCIRNPAEAVVVLLKSNDHKFIGFQSHVAEGKVGINYKFGCFAIDLLLLVFWDSCVE
jgi:hypothetical protein